MWEFNLQKYFNFVISKISMAPYPYYHDSISAKCQYKIKVLIR